MTATDPAATANKNNNMTATNKNGQEITSLDIVPVTESDAFEIAGLEAQAFLSHVATQYMFGPPTLEKQEFRANQLRESLAGAGPNSMSVKVEMEGRMVAFAHWTFNVDADWAVKAKEKEEREKEEKEKERQQNGGEEAKSDFAPGTNIGLCKEFFGWIDDVRKRRMGGVPNAGMFLLFFFFFWHLSMPRGIQVQKQSPIKNEYLMLNNSSSYPGYSSGVSRTRAWFCAPEPWPCYR